MGAKVHKNEYNTKNHYYIFIVEWEYYRSVGQ